MKRSRMVIGITGGIGSGKSTVLAILKRRGIPCASSDALAHECLRPGTSTYRRVLKVFGEDIVGASKAIDRKKLAAIVFKSVAKRRTLERLVHPCVIAKLRKFSAGRRGVVALDIPLLFEARLRSLVDIVVTVWARPAQQIARVRKRQRWTRSLVVERMKAQWPLARKTKASDAVLDNSRSRRFLALQITSLLKKIRQSPSM